MAFALDRLLTRECEFGVSWNLTKFKSFVFPAILQKAFSKPS